VPSLRRFRVPTEREHVLKRVVGLICELRRNTEDASSWTDETPLLARGIGLDSVQVVELVDAIEQDFGITISDDDLRSAHFDTLGAVVSLIERQRAGSG
jgi:acyl carrier protein